MSRAVSRRMSRISLIGWIVSIAIAAAVLTTRSQHSSRFCSRCFELSQLNTLRLAGYEHTIEDKRHRGTAGRLLCGRQQRCMHQWRVASFSNGARGHSRYQGAFMFISRIDGWTGFDAFVTEMSARDSEFEKKLRAALSGTNNSFIDELVDRYLEWSAQRGPES